jgi:hypothetical protein
MSWFPAAFRPPALACRVILFPPGDWAFLTVGLPDTRCPDPDGVPTFRTARYDRGGCLLDPGGRWCSPGRMPCPASACRFPAASPCTPRHASHRGATLHEASTKVHAIHPSGLPLACDPRMRRRPLGRSPVLRTPPSPAAHDRAGPGVSTHPELRGRHNRPPIREFTRKVRPRVATAGERVELMPSAMPSDCAPSQHNEAQTTQRSAPSWIW